MSPIDLLSQKRRLVLLNAATRLAKESAATYEIEQLLIRTIDLLSQALDLYFAGIFLIDETGQWAVLKAGSGEAGQAMLAEGHKLAVGGNSLVGQAISKREAQFIQDTDQTALRFKNPRLPAVKSELALPLACGNEIFGALTLQSDEPAAFNSEETTALQGIADQVALAVQNDHLRQRSRSLVRQTERRARLLRVSNQIARAASEIQEVDELLQKACDLICEQVGFNYTGFFLIDENGDWAVLHAGYGEAGRKMLQAHHRLKVGGNSMVGTAIHLGEARVALDVGAERIHFKNPLLPNTLSEIALPLHHGKEAFGALTVQSVEDQAFSQDDITTLQTLADFLATAVLHKKLRRRLQLAETILQQLRAHQVLTDATAQVYRGLGNQIENHFKGLVRALARVDLAQDRELIQAAIDPLAHSLESLEPLIALSGAQIVRPVMLLDVLDAAVYQAELEPGNVKIEAAQGELLVMADSRLLHTALAQLFTISQRASASEIHIQLDPQPQLKQINLKVTLQGKDLLSWRLDPYMLTAQAIKDRESASLDLYIALFAISRMQGRYSYTSHPGGDRVTLTIALIAAPAESRRPGQPRQGTVLLIDDDDRWANWAADILAEAGFTVYHRTSPRSDAQADRILIDQTLHSDSLDKILAELQATGAADNAIMLTQTGQSSYNQLSLQVGFRAIKLKPYTADELLRLLE